MIQLGLNIFLKFADENFVVCFSVVKELTQSQDTLITDQSSPQRISGAGNFPFLGLMLPLMFNNRSDLLNP